MMLSIKDANDTHERNIALLQIIIIHLNAGLSQFIKFTVPSFIKSYPYTNIYIISQLPFSTKSHYSPTFSISRSFLTDMPNVFNSWLVTFLFVEKKKYR